MNRVQLCDELPDRPGYYFMQIGPEYCPVIIECHRCGGNGLWFDYDDVEPIRIRMDDVRRRWHRVRFSKQIILEE